MDKSYLTHSGAELNEAIQKFQDSLVPTGTLPAQVILHANCNPVQPKVVLNWQWRDDNGTGIIIRRKKDSEPLNAYDGDLVCDIDNTETTSFTDENFSTDVGTIDEPAKYYYRAFPYNQNRQYQTQYQTSIELGMDIIGVYYLPNGSVMGDVGAETLLGMPLYFSRWGQSDTTIKELMWTVAHVDSENQLAYLVQTHSSVGTVMFDNAEKENPDTTRASGNARWSVSNIRQWFNTDKDKGEWFEKQHEYDTAPATYNNYPGFMHYMTEAEKNLIVPLQNTCFVPSNDGGGTETVIDYIWTPSASQNGLMNNDLTEGFVFDWFKTAENRKWDTSYWCRTPYNKTSSNTPYYVTSAGALYGSTYTASFSNDISVRAGLVLPLSSLLQYDESAEMYRVITGEI